LSAKRPDSIDSVPPSAPHLSRARRVVVLLICSMSLLIVGLDVTIVNVALPAIHRSLGASLSGLQWTIDAYTLVLASLLLLAGSTADRIGRRRVFQTGLAVFSSASLACALAPSLTWLIVFRVFQAVGGSMLNPVAMSIVRNVFEDPRERAQAIGVLAVALTAAYVPESRAPRPRRLDPVGQVLVAGALATLTYGIIEGPRAGWGSAEILGVFAVSIVCFVSLVYYELRRYEPLIEVRFFRSAPFSGASAIAVCAFASLGGFLFLNTLYLQEVRGLSPLEAGLYTLPMAATTLVCSPLSGSWIGRHGPRAALLVAACAMTASALMLTQLSPTTPTEYLFGAYFLFGLGFGLINPPITDPAVAGMPPAQAGVAAGVASTSRQVGQTLGVAVLGTVAGGGLAGAIGRDFAAATHVAWWIVAALGVVIFALGLLTTTAWARGTARETASRFGEGRARYVAREAVSTS
jgi:MFS family permease